MSYVQFYKSRLAGDEVGTGGLISVTKPNENPAAQPAGFLLY